MPLEILQDLGDSAETTKKYLVSFGGIFTLACGVILAVPTAIDFAAPLLNSIAGFCPTFDASKLRNEEDCVGVGCGGVVILTFVAIILLDVIENYSRRRALLGKLSLKGEFDGIINRGVRNYSKREGEWFFCERKSVIDEIDAKLNDHFAIQLVADPGAGKTEILKHLVDRVEKAADGAVTEGPRDLKVLGYHFCRSSDSRTLQPREFVKNLFHCAWRSGIGAALEIDRAIGELASSEQNAAGVYLRELVWEPLNKIDNTAGSKWLLIVDALDEAAGFEGKPNIVELLELLRSEFSEQPLLKWLRLVVSTRPDAAALREDGARVVGIEINKNAAMSDVRAYLKRRLGSKLTDPQFDALAGVAQGNFLLARYLARDFIDLPPEHVNERMSKLGDLPRGVDDFYEFNFRRAFGGKFPDSARKLLAIVVAAPEELSVAHLGSAAGLGLEDRNDLLEKLAGFCHRGDGRTQARSENDKVGFFHKTCADWLTLNTHPYCVTVGRGHELLATWCKDIFYIEYKDHEKGTIERCRATEPGWYLLKHGIGHFIEAERFSDAVEFVNFLVVNWDDEAAKSNPLLQKESISPRNLARALLLRLPSWKSPKAQIPAAPLINLADSVYQTGVLGRALDIILWNNKKTWRQSVEACLRSDNYVLRFKLAEALANACIDHESPAKLADVRGYLDHPDVSHAELGAYAVRHLYVAHPEKIDQAVLDKLERDRETYALAQVFGEILLNLSLRKRVRQGAGAELVIDTSPFRDIGRAGSPAESASPVRRDRDQRFWRPHWQHLALDLADAEAAISYFSAGRLDTGVHFSDEKLYADAYRHVADADELRRRLEQSKLREKYPSVARLLGQDEYFSLAKDTGPIDDIVDDLAQMPESSRNDVVKLLFSHPVWSVGETAASALAEVYQRPSEAVRTSVDSLIRDLLNPRELNWRVNLGAVEAAYILIETSSDLFCKSAREFCMDRRSSRLRALWAEDFITYILDRPPLTRLALLRDFEDCVDWWINADKEDDCWVLEHIFRLLKALDGDRSQKAGNAEYARYLNSLFGKIKSPFLIGVADWSTVSRGDFLVQIESIKRRHAAQGTYSLKSPFSSLWSKWKSSSA